MSAEDGPTGDLTTSSEEQRQSSSTQDRLPQDNAGGPSISSSRRQSLFTTLEILLIIAWAVFVARDYLNFDPNIWPHGREFGMAVQTHYIWTNLFECGSCMLWNGSINGGSPAFAELHGAVLHPFVIIPTLIFGVINGAKIGLIAALAMAGFASWWLARAMKLGLVARLWAAMMAVSGGHLAGRMDMGVFAVVLSTAAASLVIAAGVDLALNERRRSAVLLGIMLALAIVSGQGYLQIGLLLAIIPSFIILLFDEQYHLKKVWREFLLAAGIAILLAGIFLVPLLHFWPNFGKDIDAAFQGAQTPGNTLINLVISDLSIDFKGALGTFPFPYQYTIFIGWIPVILAVFSLRLVSKKGTRLLTFFIVAIILVLLTASAVTLGWLANINEELASLVRIPSLAAGLLVPLVLGLAAWSTDLLLKKEWPIIISTPTRNNGQESGPPFLTLHLSWIFVGALLLLSLYTTYTFSKEWLHTIEIDPVTLKIVDEAAAIATGREQWTHFPFGEHFWAPPALEKGLKMTGVVRPWHWRDREPPAPKLTISTEAAQNPGTNHRGTIAGLGFEENPAQHYAFVHTESEVFPCTAVAQGGHININCSAPAAGTLIVQENYFPGWSVRLDGRRVPLEPGPWLSTEAPAGDHEVSFRYRPWDVPVGFLLTILGIALCIWIWYFRSEAE